MGKHTKVGTPKYAAPQLFFEPTFTSKADIFSVIHKIIIIDWYYVLWINIWKITIQS